MQNEEEQFILTMILSENQEMGDLGVTMLCAYGIETILYFLKKHGSNIPEEVINYYGSKTKVEELSYIMPGYYIKCSRNPDKRPTYFIYDEFIIYCGGVMHIIHSVISIENFRGFRVVDNRTKS